jgi:hypothetical protein
MTPPVARLPFLENHRLNRFHRGRGRRALATSECSRRLRAAHALQVRFRGYFYVDVIHSAKTDAANDVSGSEVK